MDLPLSLSECALSTARCMSPATRKRMCEFTEAERDKLNSSPEADELDTVAKAFRAVMRDLGELGGA